ncbi:hypothetical protein ACVIHD_007968 [Bradyrhizobium embrapense]
MSAGAVAALGAALGVVRVSAAAAEAASSVTSRIIVFIGCVSRMLCVRLIDVAARYPLPKI